MKKNHKTTDDAVEILYHRYVKDDPETLAELEKMRSDEDEGQQEFDDKITLKDFDYQDPFKESLIHQLWHLVEEVKGVREEIAKFNRTVEETEKAPLITKEELMEFLSKHIYKE